MSSTVSWSRAAQRVAVSSRIPAQIWATPTGWVMNSSPEWRSWSAWRSQANSKALRDRGRGRSSPGRPPCRHPRRRRPRRRCRRRHRSRPRASRTPRPRRRGRRGARCCSTSVCVLRGIGGPPDSGRCRRETPPSAPDRSPLRIRPRPSPRPRSAAPCTRPSSASTAKQRAAASGPRGWGPPPRSASQQLLAARLARPRAGRGRRRSARRRWASCSPSAARRSAARPRPRPVQVAAAAPARRRGGQPLEVRRRAAGRRGRRARTPRARPGSRSSSAYSASLAPGVAQRRPPLGRSATRPSTAGAAGGELGERRAPPPSRDSSDTTGRPARASARASGASRPRGRDRRPSSGLEAPPPLRGLRGLRGAGVLVRIELAQHDPRLDRAVPVVDLEPHRGVDRSSSAPTPSCERPKATPSARCDAAVQAEARVLPLRPSAARRARGRRGPAAARPGCPSRTAPAGRAPRRGRGRGRRRRPSRRSARSASGPRGRAPRPRGRRRRRGRRRGSPPAAPVPPRPGARRTRSGAPRRPRGRRAGRSRGCCGPSRALPPRRRARSRSPAGGGARPAGRRRSRSRPGASPRRRRPAPAPRAARPEAPGGRLGGPIDLALGRPPLAVGPAQLVRDLRRPRLDPRSETARPRRRPGTAGPQR